jgi:23S rRNA U2552 (ribose-2'-O)-methylase RlmE/FtsJ
MSFFQLPQIQYSNALINGINPVYSRTFKNDINTSSNNQFIINKSLCKYLSFVKEQIDTRQNDWDRFKKITNIYEYIHSIIPNTKSSVCLYKPLSRSFYKMIEICKLLNIVEDLPKICKSFHLAEGPGGFIEALALMRTQKKDTYYGMTLIDDENSNVPGWRKSKTFLLNNPNVVIEKGYDERGDLMSPENLKYCYMKYNNSIDLITADGGFDFSNDFNSQEIVGSKLILCQIAFAIAIQKTGGCFIIKFFDTFTKLSLDLLFLLSILYEQVYFIKPNTSRQANSEKYIVCKGFRLYSSEELVKTFYKILTKSLIDDSQITSLFNFDLPYLFINNVEEINAIFGQQQIENIVNTLNLIDNTNNNKYDKLETMKKTNIQKCITWCQKFNLPYNQFIHSTNIFLSSRNSIIDRALPQTV